MQIPIVEAAPLVQRHATAFRDLFADRRQYEHFEQYLTGLMVLDSKLPPPEVVALIHCT
ncbi:MAG: hypothetical protein ACYDBJ_29140 [Aggregatilineales bacterium]